MRKDWKIWKALQSETGLGFNEEKKTYEMPDDWWDQFAQRYPGGDKFRNFPLAFENELDTLFSSTAARGESVHMPRSSTHDVHEEDNANIKVDESPRAFGESYEGPDSSPSQSYTADQSFTAGSQYMGTDIGRDTYSPSPTSAMPRPCLTMKGIKSSANQRWEKSLDRVCELIELRTKHAMMVSAQAENIPTIAESIAMLRDMQIIPCHAEQWSFAASLLREPENRVLFLELGDEEHRSRWIYLEYQMAMGNRGH
ncbi:hypothetical protein QJS10_CPB17g02020 [Acorus calamus]|uniref:Myb/SANT-like domain-containing protein n=1 Tax=Acorus calamus TaxID=4465 RepID=A0AAV9CSU2_ACOCL|nr:hypothetical protein QJS10_CPB17g02020 [Acorus calamus]